MTHILTAAAFERKDELGGGFRAVVLDKRTKEKYQSDVLDTIEAARHWAKTKVLAILAGQPYAPGYRYKPYWAMNVFVA